MRLGAYGKLPAISVYLSWGICFNLFLLFNFGIGDRGKRNRVKYYIIRSRDLVIE